MKEQFQKLDLTALERLPGHRFSDSRWKPTRTLRSSPTRNKKKSGVIKDFSIIMRMSQMKLTVIVCSLVVTRDNLIGSCKKPSWSKLTTQKQPHPKSTSGGKLVSRLAEQLCVFEKKCDLITYICIRSCKEIWEDSSLNELDQWNEILVYQLRYTRISYTMSGGVNPK